MKTTKIQQSLLGTISVSPAAYTSVCEIVQPYMFAPGVLEDLASFLWDFNRDGKPYDTTVIENTLSVNYSELQGIFESATARSILPTHAEAIRNEYFSIQDEKAQQEMQQSIRDGLDYFTARQLYNSKVEALNESLSFIDRKSERLLSAVDDVVNAAKNPDGISGIPTPWPHISKFTAGWQPGDLIYIPARPGMGKTTFLCECALHAAQEGFPVAFFSMGDLTAKQVYKKMAGLMSGVSMKGLRSGSVNADEMRRWQNAMMQLSDIPVHVYDLQDCSNRIGAIQDKIRWACDQNGVKVVIVDYIQQLRPDDSRLNGNAAMEEVSAKLKAAGVINDVPMLVASQLSRQVEIRGGARRPQMSDLRNSGALEQDADSIAFIYRAEYYGIEQDEEGNSLKGLTEVIFQKDRMAGDEVPASFFLKWENQRLQANTDGFDDVDDIPVTGSVMLTKTADTDVDLPF